MKQVWAYRILGLLFFFGGALCMSFIQNPKLSEVGTILLIISVVLILAGDFASRFDRLEKKISGLQS